MEIQKLKDHFIRLYGNQEIEPLCYFAPGRVNLIGEHTDYNAGYVLPCALQYGTWLLIRKTDEPVLKFTSLNIEFRTEVPVADLAARIGNEWVNYPLGVLDQFVKRGTHLHGYEFLYTGNIPTGAGLSSSASIEMVTAFAINDLTRSGLDLVSLIKLSQRAENEFVGVNCGIMDQFAVGMCEEGHALFLDCRTLEHQMVTALFDGYRLMIVNSNKPRGLVESKYNERVSECAQAVEAISRFFPVTQLGEIPFMQFYKIQNQIEDERIRRRARHVISENQRVLNAVSALRNNDLAGFGALMNASHESLKDNYEVTGMELDVLVEEAQRINGVIGARMTGAGFGGCTVNLVREDTVEQFINQVGEGYLRRTGIHPAFYKGEVSAGVRKCKEQDKF